VLSAAGHLLSAAVILVPPLMREATKATAVSPTHTKAMAFIEETKATGLAALTQAANDALAVRASYAAAPGSW
jgi:hypothetical protein